MAGDAAGLPNMATPGFAGGGVVTPFLDGALDCVGVNWLPCEASAPDRSDAAKEELLEVFDSSANDDLLFGWR